MIERIIAKWYIAEHGDRYASKQIRSGWMYLCKFVGEAYTKCDWVHEHDLPASRRSYVDKVFGALVDLSGQSLGQDREYIRQYAQYTAGLRSTPPQRISTRPVPCCPSGGHSAPCGSSEQPCYQTLSLVSQSLDYYDINQFVDNMVM
jgi:hypothetical protein